jgi:general secretion pathway protein I
MTRRSSEAGFTLLEVIIALGILFAALVVLIRSTAADVQATSRAKALTVATGLARTKMLDLEEELLHKGFQEMAETLEGDFSDEGFAKFSWSATVEKVSLPSLGDLQNAQGKAGSEGAESPVAGFLPGGSGGDTGGAMAMIQPFFGMVSGVLENAIRKVTLSLSWKVGARAESMILVCYFTDPKAVDQATGGLNLGNRP